MEMIGKRKEERHVYCKKGTQCAMIVGSVGGYEDGGDNVDGPRMDPHNVPTQSRRDQSPSPSPSPTRLGPTVRTLLSIQKSRNV